MTDKQTEHDILKFQSQMLRNFLGGMNVVLYVSPESGEIMMGPKDNENIEVEVYSGKIICDCPDGASGPCDGKGWCNT